MSFAPEHSHDRGSQCFVLHRMRKCAGTGRGRRSNHGFDRAKVLDQGPSRAGG